MQARYTNEITNIYYSCIEKDVILILTYRILNILFINIIA